MNNKQIWLFEVPSQNVGMLFAANKNLFMDLKG
jgi:hypothetical protein